MPAAKLGAAALFGALAAGALFVTFTGPASSAPRGGGCEAARAIKLVGKVAPSDAKLREATGAKVIRRAEKGQPVTLDYRPERLTVEIEKGRIFAVNCG